jgi:DNA-binding MarR family transcriptional regulator
VVDVTRKGQDTLRDATVASDEAERALLSGITKQEALVLRKLLRAIVDGS